MTIYDDLPKSNPKWFIAVNPPPIKFKATLRIYHEMLDPDSITELLQIAPTSVQRKGEQKPTPSGKLGKPVPVGGWFLSSENKVKSVNPEEHFEWLIDAISHCSGTIRKLQSQDYRTDVHCFWSTEGFNACPTLSASIMARLAAMRLDTWFDVYFVGWGEET
jgi:hypothetical protein